MEFSTPNVSASLQVVGFVGYGSSNGIIDVQGAYQEHILTYS